MGLFVLNCILKFLFYLFYVNKLTCRLTVSVKVVGANNSGADYSLHIGFSSQVS